MAIFDDRCSDDTPTSMNKVGPREFARPFHSHLSGQDSYYILYTEGRSSMNKDTKDLLKIFCAIAYVAIGLSWASHSYEVQSKVFPNTSPGLTAFYFITNMTLWPIAMITASPIYWR